MIGDKGIPRCDPGRNKFLVVQKEPLLEAAYQLL